MSKLVIEHSSDGEVVGWRYEADNDYTPGDNEIAPEPEPDHRDLDSKMVDVDTGELVDGPDYDPRSEEEKRLDALEEATGVDGTGSRGIATRLDDLEDRIAALEDLHA